MTYVALITTLTHLMYHKYLQVFVYAGNREKHVNLVNRFRHLKDDITCFHWLTYIAGTSDDFKNQFTKYFMLWIGENC